MIISEINENVFNDFAKSHTMKNFFQTKEYGQFMKYSDFNIMYIGAYENGSLVAGSLILYKTLSAGIKYGYAPRGFLIDYYNTDLLTRFTREVKSYFNKRKFAFIKINPEITFATLDYEKKLKNVNKTNRELIDTLKSLGYVKLKDHLYFESLLPKYTPVIYLPNYNFDLLNKNMIETLRNHELSGITLTIGTENDLETFYSFVKGKTAHPLSYYKKLYNAFKETGKIDLVLVSLDYSMYVKYLQKQFAYEQVNNDRINNEFRNNPNDPDLYQEKMKSDQLVNQLQFDIAKVNDKMGENPEKQILGSALIIKHEGRITLFISGCNKEFNGIDLKTYMYYKIIKDYKDNGYLYLDLYGITGDFEDTNPYKDLNEFKLKFEPTVYEYIGEFDLIVNKPFHQFLWSTNKIQKEFYRSKNTGIY
jgi:lipid II:glycine glycyltransferase (peptidoglycan interpeptide bridge formation enzyme)